MDCLFRTIQLLIVFVQIMLKRMSILALFCWAISQLNAQTTVTRSVPTFDEVSVSGGFDLVELKEGSSETVKLVLKGIDPDQITTEVKDGNLRIGIKRGSYQRFEGKIYVTYRNLKRIANSGSSDIVVASTVKGDNFAITSSGSGDVKGSFDVKKLDVSISGSSDMTLDGSADRQDYSISGSGDIDADKLKGKEAKVSISGSGDVALNVDGPVKTSVSGSGSVNNRN